MTTQGRTLQECLTSLSPDEVLAEARAFFARQLSIYAAFIDMEGPNWISLRGQGGEEVVVAAHPAEQGTRVTGSTYLFDMQVARFFASLPPLPSGATGAPGAALPAGAA
jgi:hypothetical protein